MHFVYILYSEGADIFYVGQTPDLHTRLLFHNKLSLNSFTSKHRPWTLLRSITVNNRSEAIILERYIKGRKSKDYIQRLAHDDSAVLKLLLKFHIQPPPSDG
ncbi:MAG: GIY-YIG nuclease family protein [Lewinellaceae bacterium]|nr:GIY-YIG nuclease family protein [Lewinellaceae bacterium]